jgi:hypothetical protein
VVAVVASAAQASSATAVAASLAAGAAWQAGENLQPTAVRGGGWLFIVQWGFLEDSGEFVHLWRNCIPPKKGKKSKINRIEIWISFHAKNKSIGEDLFLDTKCKIDFSSLNIQNIAD